MIGRLFKIALAIGFCFLVLIGIMAALVDTDKPSTPSEPVLSVSAVSDRIDMDQSTTVTGRVKNISDSKFDLPFVVASWYTAKGDLVDKTIGALEYWPLMAGQECAFSVVSPKHPLIAHYELQFKDKAGKRIWILPHETK
jgi:hypothetical protein